MVTRSDQRVGIFVDVQNLYHSAKNLYNARVNYKELVRHLTGERRLIRALAYVVKSEGVEGMAPADIPGREASFFDALKGAGLELRMKDIQVYQGGMKKADWDVGMAVDAIRMAQGLDVIVLVTGDGDFIPLVDFLRWGLGRVVVVAAFSRTASGKLKEAADEFIAIEEIQKSLIRIRKQSGKSAASDE
jgi:uncharacterized LabA/DUF88 family protein